jgi:hypothetical protein
LTKTIKALGELFPASFVPKKPQKESPTISVQEIRHKIADELAEEEAKRLAEEEEKRQSQGQFQPVKGKKKKSGPKKAPDSEYKENAMKHARLRDEFFRAAAQAYMHGTHDVAKELSEAGRKHHDLMKQYQEKGSEELFKHR